MIESSRSGSVAVLRMAHGKASAFDIELLRGLRGAFADAVRSDARAVVLTGTGTIFSAGVDLPRLLEGGGSYVAEFLPELSAMFRELFLLPKPVVAAVNGHAIAGGCLLAWACDRALMARGPWKIGIPELRVGVPFPLAALEIGRFALAPRVAQEALLLGRNYEAESALASGVIDELVEPDRLLDRALAAAEDLATIPTPSFARAKLDLRRPVAETWARSADHDRETIRLWSSPEVQNAVRSYAERTLGKVARQ